MRQQVGTHTWLATSSSCKKSSVGPRGLCFATTSTLRLLLVSWSASNANYCPPEVQTPDLHCSTTQYTTRLVSLFIIYRNHCETPDQQTTQHSSHYQHARTHICFHFPIGLLLIGTNCHANSAWNHQSTLSVSLCTVHQLLNRHSQPWHSSGNGLMPIAGYLPKNRRATSSAIYRISMYEI